MIGVGAAPKLHQPKQERKASEGYSKPPIEINYGNNERKCKNPTPRYDVPIQKNEIADDVYKNVNHQKNRYSFEKPLESYGEIYQYRKEDEIHWKEEKISIKPKEMDKEMIPPRPALKDWAKVREENYKELASYGKVKNSKKADLNLYQHSFDHDKSKGYNNLKNDPKHKKHRMDYLLPNNYENGFLFHNI